jgi:hypothetical protein
VAGRVVWTIAAVIGAIALVRHASTIGPVVAIGAGLALAFAGIHVLAAALPDASRTGTTPPRQRFVAAVFALGALSAPIVLLFESRQTSHAGDEAFACNGHAELCDRRVDEVTFAGTHNAMASVDAGFLFAQQRATIDAQLEAGIRALLVDTQYGLATSTEVVWTDFRGNSREAAVQELGDETVTAMEQLRRSLLPTARTAEVYLCHGYCELGATPAVDAFAGIRRFLDTHPAEVLLLFLQDLTDPVDTLQALRAAGLEQYAYTHEPGTTWPTLGELIRDRTPLVVLAERHGGNPKWFHRAFELFSDTTFRAASDADLTCTVNRGPADAPLFLLNHWIATNPVDISDARRLNSADFLLPRARRCAEERDRRVNVIAVNFASTGDLLEVVDELNEVGGA